MVVVVFVVSAKIFLNVVIGEYGGRDSPRSKKKICWKTLPSSLPIAWNAKNYLSTGGFHCWFFCSHVFVKKKLKRKRLTARTVNVQYELFMQLVHYKMVHNSFWYWLFFWHWFVSIEGEQPNLCIYKRICMNVHISMGMQISAKQCVSQYLGYLLTTPPTTWPLLKCIINCCTHTHVNI